jgi:hypothetical protein
LIFYERKILHANDKKKVTFERTEDRKNRPKKGPLTDDRKQNRSRKPNNERKKIDVKKERRNVHTAGTMEQEKKQIRIKD